MKLTQSLRVGVLLAGGLLASTLAVAGGFGHGRGGMEHGFGHHHARMMHVVEALDLSDAQEQALKEAFRAEREQSRAQHQALRELHRAFDAAVPGSPEFQTASLKLADAAADAARLRVQHHTAMRQKLHGLLTEQQQAKFAQLMAERRARGLEAGHHED